MRLAVFTAILMLAASPALAADPVEGLWLTQDGQGKVRVAPCPGKADEMCGVVASIKDPTKVKALDANNPDPALRGKPLMGLTIIWGFKALGPGKWTGGHIYEPEAGRTWNAKMSAAPDGKLKVEGCFLVICQAQTWTPG